MKRFKILAFLLLFVVNIFANDTIQEDSTQNKQEEIDKLDMLDKQSKDFYMAVTGLEKEYLEDQLSKTKEQNEKDGLNKQKNTNAQGIFITKEEQEKNLFNHQNELARITTDFTRTKKLKDLKIKGMYNFNDTSYVVLLLDDETSRAKPSTELSGNIEGRYILGDKILGHKIVNINTRTKSVELFKDLDKSVGYTVYLSNYGITLSNLEKIDKNHPRYFQITGEKEIKKVVSVAKEKEIEEPKNDEIQTPIKKTIEKKSQNIAKTESLKCYKVNKNRLNVRSSSNLKSKVLKILEEGDIVKVSFEKKPWVNLDTIYYKDSKRVVKVKGQNNWIQNLNGNLVATKCK
ncbi:hypothetical protein [Arcobacter porcinus]|uniref:hypothetical protein n=1 Tax=Arcobacter porcinus TaxID=1935204 RepID=UPI000824C89E|nr:hypothetical protein [Arcobacter porcinus]OCL82246.1 hypothetical protein AAW30_01531 [Arcobacter porcinus]OCL88277.1 hypothetical protein AAX30_00893 [Arcobacter porcinus]